MSETLRDLVVSLSLQTDNFTRNIKSVNTQIKEAESAFKLAAAGVENFESTTSGLAAKQTTLTRQLNLQKAAVEQYKKALEAAKNHLKECQANQAKFEQNLANAKGANASASELKKLNGQVEATRKATQNAADAVSATSAKLNNAEAAVKNTKSALDHCKTSISAMNSSWTSSAQVMERNQNTISMLGLRMQTVQSSFALASAGVKNVAENTTVLAAKLKMLSAELNIQQTTIHKYEESLKAAKTQLIAAQKENDPEKIRQARTAVEENTAALNNARAAYANTQQAIRETNNALTLAQNGYYSAGAALKTNEAAVASLGKQMQLAESKFRLAGAGIENFGRKAAGVAAKLDLLKEKQTLLRQQVVQLKDAVKNAQTQLEAAKASGDSEKIQAAKDKLTELNTTLNITEATLREVTHELILQSSAWTRTGTTLVNFSTRAKAVSSTMVSTGRTMTRWITTPLVSLTTAAVNAAVQFEKTFATVRKTVKGTEETYAELEAASKRMSTELATGTDEINEVMSTAGQLGIATENIESFTKTMIDLGNSTTDLDANTAATEIAKFINIMGTSQKDVDRLGSSLAYIGNRYATTEAPIMEMAMRIAGAGKQVGMTEAEVLGVATALSSVGIEAQMGGSAFSKALIKMEVAAEEGGQELQDFADISGMTADEFKKLWNANPTEAFIAFVKGLAQLDDEGVSTIATLQELGFTEIRLRDTMLRTVSNTQLMENAVADATKGWEENTALTKLAGEIYSTTAAKLTNLKNKASLAGQQIASDLDPTIQNLIGSASDLLDKFMGLDEQQRLSIIKWGAVAASIGPALLIMGRLIGVVGGVTGAVGKGMQAIGKFSAAITTAGGGVTGFVKVVLSSKVAVAALAAAVIYGAYKLYDYASGAKAAREALEGMNKTAEEWKNTAAETFYGSGEGLGFFGMSTDDFVNSTKQIATATNNAVQDWMDGMIAVWSDGKYETDAIVKEWQDSSSEVSKETLERMKELRTQAQESGDTAKAQELDADIAALEALDKRISDNLRFFQGKNLTDASKAFWQGLTDEKQAILLKWGFAEEPVGGNEAYDTIAQKVEAARARAQAIGKDDADVTVYEEAVLAASQGFAAISKQIDDQYDAEYANIQLMADGAEKNAALEKLNTDYVQQRTQAAAEYAAAMQNAILPVWNQSDVQKAKADVADMAKLMSTYSAQSGDTTAQAATLEQMEALAAGMSEGALTEYYTLLTQIQSLLDYGIPESTIKEWFPDIDYSAGLQQLAAIQEFFKDRPGQLTGLASIFGEALPEEVIKIATDLDMTGAQARWNEFAANPGAITTQAVIDGYEVGEKAKAQQFKVDAFIKKYTEVPEGADKSSLTIDGLLAYVKTYAEQTTGADVSDLTPENLTAIVSAYNELAEGADVSALTPDEIAAFVMEYLEANDVDTSALAPSSVIAAVMAYEETRGGASTNELTPGDIAAIVVEYLEDEDVDLSALTEPQIDGIVAAYAEATNCDKSALKAEVVAQITDCEKSETFVDYIPMKIALVGYDTEAYNNFIENNKVTVDGIVRLGNTEYGENPEAVLSGDSVKFYGLDGLEIPVTAVPTELLDASTLCALDDDGTLHVFVTPEITGSPEAIAEARAALSEKYVTTTSPWGTSTHDWGFLNSILGGSTLDWIKSFNVELEAWQKNKGTWVYLWGLLDDLNLSGIDKRMTEQLGADAIGQISTYVCQMVAAIQNGAEVSEEDLAALQTIVTLLTNLERTGTGENIRAGITEGLSAAGFEAAAETVAEDLESALGNALEVHGGYGRSFGEDIAAGIGEGQANYDFTDDSRSTVHNAASALRNELNVHGGYGRSFGEDIAAGIGEGQANYDFTDDAETTISNDEDALRTAADSHSPAVRMKPLGADIAAGIGEGMAGYDFSAYASSTVGNLQTALSAVLLSGSLRSVGLNAMYGMAAGIRAGRANVVSAMRSAAQAAVSAAKTALQIHSPSRVFRDEVGAMTMKGFGEGVLDETKEQAKIISNAARYLTGAAGSSAIAATNDNRKTYNNDNSTSFSFAGATFTVRSDQDVHDLAVEIATLTRRNQRGRGLRLA